MKNDTTELVFILDESGSMAGLESDTIGGFNGMLQKQKNQQGKCYVSTFLFSSGTEMLHDRVAVENVAQMTDADYQVGGCTALMDAMGEAITHIEKIHKYIRPEDVPAHTIFVITTDGMENASKKYDSAQIKKMVEAKKESGWEFIFLAANIDAVDTAKHFGISENRAVNYVPDAVGTGCLYDAISATVSNVRAGKGINDTWSKNLNEDYKKRG